MFKGMREEEVPWQGQHLSSDTLLHVFQFLTSRDACRASSVCKAWHRGVERLDWESRYKRLWGPPPRVHATSLRAAFSEHMCRARALTLRARRCGGQGHPREIKCIALLASAGVVVTGKCSKERGGGCIEQWSPIIVLLVDDHDDDQFFSTQALMMAR